MDDFKYNIGDEVLLKGKVTMISLSESGVVYTIESNSVATTYDEDQILGPYKEEKEA